MFWTVTGVTVLPCPIFILFHFLSKLISLVTFSKSKKPSIYAGFNIFLFQKVTKVTYFSYIYLFVFFIFSTLI